MQYFQHVQCAGRSRKSARPSDWCVCQAFFCTPWWILLDQQLIQNPDFFLAGPLVFFWRRVLSKASPKSRFSTWVLMKIDKTPSFFREPWVFSKVYKKAWCMHRSSCINTYCAATTCNGYSPYFHNAKTGARESEVQLEPLRSDWIDKRYVLPPIHIFFVRTFVIRTLG